ncbi:MAG TPA: sulfatase-like hydrolase/transferase [Granulicella sp.]|nr:sulfatase-like hydrolase/transferase [Granulicella sp.]
MRFLTHPVVIALGLTNLYLLALSGPLISPAHDLVYHLIGASSSLFVPILVYMVALWALLTGLLLLARTPAPKTTPDTTPDPGPRRVLLRLLIWYGLLLTLPWSLLHTCAGFVGWEVPGWIDLLFAAASLATLALILRRPRALLHALGEVEPVLSAILSFFALSGVLILSQMLWFALQARDLNPPTRLHHAQPADLAADSPHPRIIWILLDELSYQQVYERRYPGLELPAFDQLAAQATNFTHVVPAGEFTRNILPTLFTGIPTNHIQVDGRGMLRALHDSVAHRWKPFDPHQTVFQDALDHGYSTGVAGWYNPYCRILPDVLDSCYWVYHEATPARLLPNRTAARNLFRPLRLDRRRLLYLLYRLHLRSSAPPPPPNDDQLDIRMHASDYHDLLAAGDHLLDDSSIDFVFLHLPIPHPFGFYDRHTGTIASVHTSYLDNLALADIYLAHVRQLLERRHEWDSSTVVVMGDHSWRTSFIWVDAGSWTEEEDRASNHGEFDPRPGYLVKLPNQHQPARIDQPFDAVRTRALLDALLANTLKTPADLAHWTATK